MNTFNRIIYWIFISSTLLILSFIFKKDSEKTLKTEIIDYVPLTSNQIINTLGTPLYLETAKSSLSQ